MKETNLIVNGMMCGGCENRVKNAIKNIEGVENVTADHNTGKVIVISDNEVSEEIINSWVSNPYHPPLYFLTHNPKSSCHSVT